MTLRMSDGSCKIWELIFNFQGNNKIDLSMSLQSSAQFSFNSHSNNVQFSFKGHTSNVQTQI